MKCLLERDLFFVVDCCEFGRAEWQRAGILKPETIHNCALNFLSTPFHVTSVPTFLNKLYTFLLKLLWIFLNFILKVEKVENFILFINI